MKGGTRFCDAPAACGKEVDGCCCVEQEEMNRSKSESFKVTKLSSDQLPADPGRNPTHPPSRRRDFGQKIE